MLVRYGSLAVPVAVVALVAVVDVSGVVASSSSSSSSVGEGSMSTCHVDSLGGMSPGCGGGAQERESLLQFSRGSTHAATGALVTEDAGETHTEQKETVKVSVAEKLKSMQEALPMNGASADNLQGQSSSPTSFFQTASNTVKGSHHHRHAHRQRSSFGNSLRGFQSMATDLLEQIWSILLGDERPAGWTTRMIAAATLAMLLLLLWTGGLVCVFRIIYRWAESRVPQPNYLGSIDALTVTTKRQPLVPLPAAAPAPIAAISEVEIANLKVIGSAKDTFGVPACAAAVDRGLSVDPPGANETGPAKSVKEAAGRSFGRMFSTRMHFLGSCQNEGWSEKDDSRNKSASLSC